MFELTPLSQALTASRRTFLLRSAGTLAFPMALAACGGGGSGPDDGTGNPAPAEPGTPVVPPVTTPVATPAGNLTRSNAKGTITLPAGATVKIASVENAFASNVPAADGSFDFVSVAESEMFAIAIGPGGKMVLSGLLQAGTAQLSARSTAVCLAYTALGVGVFLPSMQEQYLAAIQASPTLTALEAAVAAAIVARGEGWLDLTDPPLNSALAALQQALAPAAIGGVTVLTAQGQLHGDVKAAGEARVQPQGMSIDKPARVSGLQVVGDGFGTITITNFYRRRSYAYIERLSYKETYTGADIDSPAIVGVQPLKVDATKSITNTLVTLAQYFGGVDDFYDPVVSDKIPTPLAPTSAALTTYRVTSVGLGVTAGDKALLTAQQAEGLRNVCAETFILDIAVPIICGILIPLKTAPMKSFIETLALSRLKDLISTLAAADDFLVNKIVAGNRPLKEVLWDALLTLVNTDSFKNAILLFAQDIIDSLSAAEFAVLPRTNVVNLGAKALLDAISALDLAAQTMDIAAVGLSLAFSDLADRFTIDVSKSAVRLNPLNPLINPGQETVFTLSVIDSDVAVGDLSYEWSCTCQYGDIKDGFKDNTTAGNTFSSSSATVTYTPRPNAKGGDQDVIIGTIYKGQLNNRVPLGSVMTTVAYNTVITPGSVQLLIKTKQTFTADISAKFLSSGTGVKYVWTLTGLGTIGDSPIVTTTLPTITYTAPEMAGADKLELNVTDLRGTVISKASAAITVLGSVVAGIAPQNPRVARSTALNFAVVPLGPSFPSGTTFKWVLTHAPDLFGRTLPIGTSGGGVIGVGITPTTVSGAPLPNSITVVTKDPSITFTANPFGPESNGTTFAWLPELVLTVTVLGASGNVLTTSSTPIQTQVPTSILLP
ncbi:hypothetical protein BH10PSE17_BH10PSE17_00730 [soil metagenome]